MVDYFSHKAKQYEQNKDRVDNVAAIAGAILEQVVVRPDMELVDFGSGTGLLLEQVAPHVKKITAIDVSPAMNEQLRAKVDRIACEIVLDETNLEETEVDGVFDGIISSMTLHHIRDVGALLVTFHRMLKPGGFIALADLEAEDGTFHRENTGVHHLGFEPDQMANWARAAGFNEVETSTVSVINKEERAYPVFLVSGIR